MAEVAANKVRTSTYAFIKLFMYEIDILAKIMISVNDLKKKTFVCIINCSHSHTSNNLHAY